MPVDITPAGAASRSAIKTVSRQRPLANGIYGLYSYLQIKSMQRRAVLGRTKSRLARPIGMSESFTVAGRLKSNLGHLLFAAPPILFGWIGTGVFVVILWWIFLAIGAFLQEYRPDPHYDELRERPKAFAIALVMFVGFYYAARWLATA